MPRQPAHPCEYQEFRYSLPPHNAAYGTEEITLTKSVLHQLHRGLPVARPTGTEPCSCTINQLPPILR
jgi:hypothetical protein